MVTIYTSQYAYKGDDRIDTTVKTSDGVFAPTWDIVMGHKRGNLSDKEYTEVYLDLMRASYQKNPEAWNAILKRERVTLVCFCKAGNFCHRVLLAKLFEKLGATYAGEIPHK